MKKFEEYFSIIYILGGFLIPICIVLLIYYTFVGKSYYNVSSKNEETISMLLSQVTEIKEESWQEAIEACVPPKFLELNKKAFESGKMA